MGTLGVLVASPDEATRNQAGLALGGGRFDVAAVTDTDAAVRRIAEHPPTVLVADLELGGAGALALARTLRSRPETRGVRVVLLTRVGVDAPGDAPGVDAVLAAPFTSLSLLRKVETLVRAEDPAAFGS